MEVVNDLPYDYARRHRVCVTDIDSDNYQLFFQEQLPTTILNEIQRYVGSSLPLVQIEEDAFESLLQKHYEGKGSSSSEVFSNLSFDEQADLSELSAAVDESGDILDDTNENAPIPRLINAIFFEAVREKASDIHMEPYERQILVRFRIDGVLKTILTADSKITLGMVSRVKIMAKLDIAEKRVPQDGRISLRIGGRAIDMRVSTIPSAYGERVVMRLLDKEATRLVLDKLGMPSNLQTQLEQMIARPHGVILVTGPTGSGKTTTLYACLSEMDSKRLNIMTVEDPIEYYFEGISQTQVNTRANMNFARGLRAILRQDPDVVMIGEIRDGETAQISVQASLTGHLVLSTLHTNTAIGAITRLRDMGVESFLIASTVQAVLAQRLVRRLCTHCKRGYIASRSELETLGLDPERQVTLYEAQGCEHCYQTGYLSRIGIYELLVVDQHIRQLIHEDGSELDIEEHARKLNPSLRQTGFQLAQDGLTSLSEVLRVTQD